MAEDRASIDGSTILDNVDERRIEFSAEVGGDWYDFALSYSVLEALGGAQIGADDDVIALFDDHRDEAEEAAAKALARGSGEEPVIVDEADIL
ncbi:MAG: DUF1488 family protein [Janthinobacterium lividum]